MTSAADAATTLIVGYPPHNPRARRAIAIEDIGSDPLDPHHLEVEGARVGTWDVSLGVS